MGACVSISNKSACSSTSNEQKTTSSSPWADMFLCKRNRPFTDRFSSFRNLPSIPNRAFTNGKTSSSCIFTQQGRKGVNQDAMIVWEDFTAEDVTFCGVFDGHGPHGHLVARKVRDTLPLKLSSYLNSSKSKESRSNISNCCNKNMKFDVVDPGKESMDSPWREAFLKSYKAMDKELRSHPNLNSFCSGSTAVTVIKQGSNLFVGYIGDSRAILGSRDSSDSMVATQLSVDLKPDLPREAERIKRCKGRVFAMQDEPEVHRVWLPFDDAPGLAMARAFGDFCLKDYGVISIPEFSHTVLSDQDEFIVLASDGVWDVLTNQEVVEIVSSAPTRSSAARTVVEFAAREWKSKYPTSKMDDCAVVCLFLDGKMDSDYEEHRFSSHSNNHSTEEESEDDNINDQKSNSVEPWLMRSSTVRSSTEEEDHGWSGLEGVTRVNSLVHLPRFSEERAPT